MSHAPFHAVETYRPVNMDAFQREGELVIEKYDRRCMGIYFSDENELSALDDLRAFYDSFGLKDAIVSVEADRECLITDWGDKYLKMAGKVRLIGELLLPRLDIVQQTVSDGSVVAQPVVVFPVVGMTDTEPELMMGSVEHFVLKGLVPVSGILEISHLQGLSGYITDQQL